MDATSSAAANSVAASIGFDATPEKTILQKSMDMHVGPLPLPIYILLAAVIFGAAYTAKLPIDMIGGFAVIMIMGWLFGDIGMKTPILKDIGGPAIASMFIPSILVYLNWLHPEALKAITAIMKTSNFLYLYISCLVCGSILGMPRKILVQGFIRMFVPLVFGSLAAIAAGVAVGLLFGYDAKHTFFFIVVPILGGGIGEGILPYSLGMAEILNQPQSSLIPQLAPAAMLGNVAAIIICAYMAKFGESHDEYNGHGLLVKTNEAAEMLKEMNKEKKIEFSKMGIGLIVACSAFTFGALASPVLGIPGAIIMIFTAALVKALNIVPTKIEEGAYLMYRFIATNLTWPLLVGLGVLYMPFKDVLAAITPAYIVICVSIVVAMVSCGFFVGKLLGMYPVESAIVTGCHSGLGGTGDVAILSAANRMELMPFAQVSTRLGGACTVVVAILLLKLVGI